ncbi:MAG: hypothetical protein V4667_05420 [Bacteroidota bacterium]
MKTENNHKKDYRKKIETQLHNLVEAHLSNINKDAASKLGKTIQEAVKQIAKKFYKTHFSIETDKNEKVISQLVKAKSIKKLPSKSLPAKASSIKFDKIIEKKVPKVSATKKTVAVKKVPIAIGIKKATPIKKATVKKSTTKKLPIAIGTKKTKSSAPKSNSLLSSIPKEFKMTISKKTSKK